MKERKEFGEVSILGIDLGTITGWAMLVEGKIRSGSVSFKQSRFEGGGMRYLKFERWLSSLPKVGLVYFEEVRRHLGADAAHAYGGFLSHLTAWCEMRGIPYQGVGVGTIKRFIAGKGNASKLEVMESVRGLGFSPVDDNEADALAILHLAMEESKTTKKSIVGVEK